MNITFGDLLLEVDEVPRERISARHFHESGTGRGKREGTGEGATDSNAVNDLPNLPCDGSTVGADEVLDIIKAAVFNRSRIRNG